MPDERIPEDEPAEVRFRGALEELEKKGLGDASEDSIANMPDIDDKFEESIQELQGKARAPKAETTLPEVPAWSYKKPESINVSERREQVSAKGQRAFGLALSIGYAFVVPILAGVAIGAWIDGGIGGAGTIIGLLLGSATALFLLVKLVNKLNESQQ